MGSAWVFFAVVYGLVLVPCIIWLITEEVRDRREERES